MRADYVERVKKLVEGEFGLRVPLTLPSPPRGRG
jgi:hypothetical protein